MSFLQNSILGSATDDYTVMFDDLSDDAQEKLCRMEHHDSCWQMLPLAHLYESKHKLSQNEIDDAALLTVGFYH